MCNIFLFSKIFPTYIEIYLPADLRLRKKFGKIIFSFNSIKQNDGRWSYAAGCLWCAGCVSDGQPSDYVLQGGVSPPHELRDGVH